MKENGLITTCMEKVYTHGKMEENMMVNINMIRNMDLEYMCGQIKEYMKDFGLMASSMEKESIFYLTELLRLEFGRMEREPNG